MNVTQPERDRQPPVGLPRERLLLPGPRITWWLLAILTMAVPLATD